METITYGGLFMNKTFNDLLPYSTVRIEAIVNNNPISTGTGFFFLFCDNLEEESGSFIPGIVTNKHVIEGAEKIRFLLRMEDRTDKKLSEGKYESVQFEIDNTDENVIHHPESDVDLCVIPITKEKFYTPFEPEELLIQMKNLQNSIQFRK
jgi:hypothetical protein